MPQYPTRPTAITSSPSGRTAASGGSTAPRPTRLPAATIRPRPERPSRGRSEPTRTASASPAAITTTWHASRSAGPEVGTAAPSAFRTLIVIEGVSPTAEASSMPMTSVCGSHAHPAATAVFTRKVSSVSRDTTAPPGNGSRASRFPPATRMRSRGTLPAGSDASGEASCAWQPRSSSSARAVVDIQHPHTLGRGIVPRSTSSVRNPARASLRAVALPAGPAPTTTTSQTRSL